MVGFGPPASRPARREWWRRQIQRQCESSLSVAEFCRRLGVSAVTFYAWKRRLRDTPLDAPSRLNSRAAEPAPAGDGASAPAFVPVAIREAGPHGHLEIALANACVVRLTGAVDPALLRIAIRAAGRLVHAGPGAP